MSWREFKLRLFSYNRVQKNELYKLRQQLWITYIAPSQDPKKMKRNIDSFMPIGKKGGANEELRERGRRAMAEYEQYLIEKNGGIKC